MRQFETRPQQPQSDGVLTVIIRGARYMSAAVTLDPAIQTAIDSMKEAFTQAIQANAEITKVKTLLGAEETAAQQRPNIG